jgi:hypothetical protein
LSRNTFSYFCLLWSQVFLNSCDITDHFNSSKFWKSQLHFQLFLLNLGGDLCSSVNRVKKHEVTWRITLQLAAKESRHFEPSASFIHIQSLFAYTINFKIWNWMFEVKQIVDILLLTLNLLTWKMRWVPNNASKWQMGFNSAF